MRRTLFVVPPCSRGACSGTYRGIDFVRRCSKLVHLCHSCDGRSILKKACLDTPGTAGPIRIAFVSTPGRVPSNGTLVMIHSWRGCFCAESVPTTAEAMCVGPSHVVSPAFHSCGVECGSMLDLGWNGIPPRTLSVHSPRGSIDPFQTAFRPERRPFRRRSLPFRNGGDRENERVSQSRWYQPRPMPVEERPSGPIPTTSTLFLVLPRPIPIPSVRSAPHLFPRHEPCAVEHPPPPGAGPCHVAPLSPLLLSPLPPPRWSRSMPPCAIEIFRLFPPRNLDLFPSSTVLAPPGCVSKPQSGSTTVAHVTCHTCVQSTPK